MHYVYNIICQEISTVFIFDFNGTSKLIGINNVTDSQ